MISPQANINSNATIGQGSRIAEGTTLGPGVALGNDVNVAEGAILVHAVIGDNVEIGPGAMLCGNAGATLRVEPGVVIMAGAVVSAPVVIATGARIQPGAVVVRDVPPHAIVTGNPAQIIGYTVSSDGDAPVSVDASGSNRDASVTPTLVRGVTLHRFPKILDLRGNLTVGEFGRTVPFEPKRYFMVFGVPNAEIRGEHAHRECKQFLLCTQGRCSVVADDGHHREEFLLDDPSVGLYLPPLTWGVQYKYSPDAVLLVFASHYYDSAEYIRSYQEFRTLTAGIKNEGNA